MESQEMISFLQQLVAFPTIAGHNDVKRACMDWILSTFFVSSPHGISRGDVGGCPYVLLQHRSPRWLWFAHCDVVPGSPEQFSLRHEGDTLLGRGVKDMKGAALPFFLAYRDAILSGEDPQVDILFSTDEEVNGTTIPHLLAEGLSPAIAFTPDTGSSPGIVVEHKGAAWISVECSGKAAHGALPWEARNPIMELTAAFDRITQAYPPGTCDDWKTTVSVTRLQAGDAANRTPDVAKGTLDVRFIPEDATSAEEMLTRIRALLPPHCTATLENSACSLHTDRNHPFIQEFIRTVERIEGVRPPCIREHGATDARHFGAAQIPAFLYGPRGGDLHGPREWVSLSSLMKQYALYRELFRIL